MILNKTVRIVLAAGLITGLALCAFAAGVGLTWALMDSRTARAEEAAGFSVFWEAWRLVEDTFYGDLPTMQQVAWGAIRGALTTLDDPHTSFLEPQPRQREREDLSGRFGGIGAYVTQAEDGSITLDPMPGLPAELAGVQTGDVVLRVDDTAITPEMSVDQVAALVRGEVGTIVRLTLRREGVAEPLVLEIKRQEIPSPSVESRMVEGAPGIGYVRVMLFSDRTPKEIREALKELKAQGMDKLILDLRNNGGGLLQSGIDVASEFLDGQVILYQVSRSESERVERAKAGGAFTSGPLVVLVNGSTASASEIVAGALQGNGRAEMIGEKTYGKGSVQSVFDLSDGSSVHITSAQWLTPNRHQISGQGLTPDLEVLISEEDRSQGRDTQLERAIEYLVNGQ